MTKPLTIEIDEAAAAQLARIAGDLGETPEEFATRAGEARMEAFQGNPFFARRAKSFDPDADAAWLKELAERRGGSAPDPDDALPEGYKRPR